MTKHAMIVFVRPSLSETLPQKSRPRPFKSAIDAQPAGGHRRCELGHLDTDRDGLADDHEASRRADEVDQPEHPERAGLAISLGR